MQAFLGIAILVIILGVSIFFGISFMKNSVPIVRISNLVRFVITVIVIFIVCYVALFILGGFIWFIAEIGIFLREIIQWLYESLIYPFSWLF